MENKDLEKNVLDLQHSVNLAKAGSFLALGFSSWIALFFGMKEFYSNILVVLFIASLVSVFFFYYAFKFFKNCDGIHLQIKNMKN